MFKLQSPSKYSPSTPIETIYLLRLFFHCSKQCLSCSTLMPFSASTIFCFTSSKLAKNFPLRTFIIQGNKKIVTWGQDWVIREGGAWAICHFWSKITEHSVPCGQVCSQITHHEMDKHINRVLKNIH